MNVLETIAPQSVSQEHGDLQKIRTLVSDLLKWRLDVQRASMPKRCRRSTRHFFRVIELLREIVHTTANRFGLGSTKVLVKYLGSVTNIGPKYFYVATLWDLRDSLKLTTSPRLKWLIEILKQLTIELVTLVTDRDALRAQVTLSAAIVGMVRSVIWLVLPRMTREIFGSDLNYLLGPSMGATVRREARKYSRVHRSARLLTITPQERHHYLVLRALIDNKRPPRFTGSRPLHTITLYRLSKRPVIP
ncbi:protein TE28 [Testudinid alphaherpesvirus 3]|uniref:Protein TE28 n=1 Tax=Testudinid alphaherpesvirus 3 TaxID=2560801 RepID=A0A0M3WM94_9ALPH|nr:protein TE28 [Testudinid alphaherpesvirus 3]AKI81685.1 protein TE28 [Testudinid alphaherpesvirus 3]AKI81788.1 protein TE28 [Testudinid alphaherpesvirus 3]